jgi:hypothetical protein
MKFIVTSIAFATLSLITSTGLSSICVAADEIQGIQTTNLSIAEIRIAQKVTYIYFGEGYKADSSVYHTKTKKSILAKVGSSNFSSVVGTNPDVKVIGGKIVLVGAGADFKGKSYPTDLDASDFFSK